MTNPRRSSNGSRDLGRLFPSGRDSRDFGLTAKLTVKEALLVTKSNGDNGLEMQEIIEWE